MTHVGRGTNTASAASAMQVASAIVVSAITEIRSAFAPTRTFSGLPYTAAAPMPTNQTSALAA